MVFDELNSQVHSQIKLLLENDVKSQYEHHDLDIDQFLKETNSEVWEAVCSLTRSVSERRGTSKVHDPSSLAHHTKKLHHFFCFALCSFAPMNDAQCHYMYFWQTEWKAKVDHKFLSKSFWYLRFLWYSIPLRSVQSKLTGESQFLKPRSFYHCLGWQHWLSTQFCSCLLWKTH